MPTILLALEAMTPFLESLVTGVVGDAKDIDIVREFPEAARDEVPKVLLVGSGVSDGAIDSKLRQRLRLTVLRLEDRGHGLTIHQMRPQRWTRRNTGPDQLLEIIRTAAHESSAS